MTNTTTLAFELDLADDAEALRRRIVQRAAVHMLQQVSAYSDGEERFTELGRELRDDISKAIRTKVAEAVGPAVAAALAEGVQRTDNYGVPSGPKVSLREVIIEEAHKVLSKKIEVRDNYNRSESVIQQVIRDEVQRTLTDELKAEIKAESERVKKAVRDKAAEIVTESVRRAALV